jgi:protein TonB
VIPSDLTEELIEPEPQLNVLIDEDREEMPPFEPEVATPVPSVNVGEMVEPGPKVNPPVMLTRPKPTYPHSALRLKKEAEVTVRLLVDENGQVQEADRIGPKAGMGFDQAAISAAKLTRWQPATKEGVRVSMWAELTIQFRP